MLEKPLMDSIQIFASEKGARVFRNNVGMGWVGKAFKIRKAVKCILRAGDVIVRKARPLHAGLGEGSSDLIGATPVVITQEMVGKTMAVFTAIEVKSESGTATPEQIDYINWALSIGGRAGIARSKEDAAQILAG